MTIRIIEGGYIIAEAFVTDGVNRWRERMSYLYYTQREARARFKQYLKDNKLIEVK